MFVILGDMIDDAGFSAMGFRAAQFLGRNHFAGRGLHQRRAGEEDRALIAHNHRLIGHGRHIGAARRAASHHASDLRDTRRRHLRLIVEDAAEMIAVRKDFRLMRQVGPAGIDQIDAGQAVFRGDLLRPQMLLHRHREIGAALHRRVMGDDHAFAA
ncbi:hypothetical protein D3C80_826670 [compost metagenome]